MMPFSGVRPNGFNLDSRKDFAAAHDNIVAVTVSPGLGNGEAQGCGLAHKGEFGEFAALFSIEVSCMQQLVFQRFFGKWQIEPQTVL